MRRARLVVCIVASMLAAPTPAARLVAVGATVLSATGCSKCTLEITTPDPLPDGGVGHAYFFQMTAIDDGCGGGTWLQWSARGLPPNMKFSEDGALDGIPTRAGTYSFDVTAWVIDINSSDSPTVTRRYTLTIHPA